MLSLPAWGAWIEIADHAESPDASVSLPAWGAWIEILKPGAEKLCSLSLPAWGAWIEIFIFALASPINTVAPRVGSVD